MPSNRHKGIHRMQAAIPLRVQLRCSTSPRTRAATALFFFFNDTATTEIYTLSLHDALPISPASRGWSLPAGPAGWRGASPLRSEEHTSELQSLAYLVCRLLLEKKKNKI